MKRLTFFLLAIFPIILISCSQTQESKAKQLIKEYLEKTLDDYDSYSSVSYSKVERLMTKWEFPKELEPDLEKLIKIAERINLSGYNNIDVTSDADYFIQDLKKSEEEKYKKNTPAELAKKIELWKSLWNEFKHYQDIIHASKNSFIPQFIGWKVIHSYRAKNRMGATVLNEHEFRFDKEMTKVIKIKESNINTEPLERE